MKACVSGSGTGVTDIAVKVTRLTVTADPGVFRESIVNVVCTASKDISALCGADIEKQPATGPSDPPDIMVQSTAPDRMGTPADRTVNAPLVFDA